MQKMRCIVWINKNNLKENVRNEQKRIGGCSSTKDGLP